MNNKCPQIAIASLRCPANISGSYCAGAFAWLMLMFPWLCRLRERSYLAFIIGLFCSALGIVYCIAFSSSMSQLTYRRFVYIFSQHGRFPYQWWHRLRSGGWTLGPAALLHRGWPHLQVSLLSSLILTFINLLFSFIFCC